MSRDENRKDADLAREAEELLGCSSEVAFDHMIGEVAAGGNGAANLTGLELARELVQTRPDIPIVLCTGFSETVSAEQAQAWGIRGYVMKPVIAADLAAALRQVLDEDKEA
jgi:DNA-binding NarL/FixJ family response regulator